MQEILEFLHAIGKQSMQTGQIDVYARRRRLRRVLDEQLGDPRSEVIRAIVSKLRSLGLNGILGSAGASPSPGVIASREAAKQSRTKTTSSLSDLFLKMLVLSQRLMNFEKIVAPIR